MDGFGRNIGITVDRAENMIWVTTLNSISSIPQIFKFDLNGNGSYYADIGPTIESLALGILIGSDGLPLVPLVELDKVVKVDSLGGTSDIWTQNISSPTDLDFAPVLPSIIAIDIKPGKNSKNKVSLNKNKSLKVAIVGTETFEVIAK